jgi:transcriptional regulator with XRE-family HTH domain
MIKHTNTTPEQINQSQIHLINQWNVSHDLNETIFTKIAGLQLRKIRLIKKLTQTKVAKALNVSFQQIQKYERGQNEISIIKIKKLCEIFNVDLDYFIRPLLKEDLNFDTKYITYEKKKTWTYNKKFKAYI